MSMDTRCIDGTLYRTPARRDPDDPYYEYAVGRCQTCHGEGCRTCDCCDGTFPRDEVAVTHYLGMETWACEECRS